MKEAPETPDEQKADEAVASRRSEVIIAVSILILLVILVVVVFKLFGKPCSGESQTTAGKDQTALRFKDRYKGGDFQEYIKGKGWGSEAYDDERLSEFYLGGGRFIETVDFRKALMSPNASVFGWFRVPPTDGIIHLAEMYGHSAPRSEGRDADLRPGQKMFQFLLLRDRLTVHLYSPEGGIAQTVSVSNTTVRDGQWHLLGFTSGKEGVSIYMDGMQLVNQRRSAGIPTNVYPAALSVGKSSDPKFFASNFTFSVSDMGKIKAGALYNNGIPQNPTNIISDLRLWIPMQAGLVSDSTQNSNPVIVSGPKRAEKLMSEKSNADVQSLGRFVKKVKAPTSFLA